MYETGDFALIWPRDLFRTELVDLINAKGKLIDWDRRVELLLEDAFASEVPRDLFTNTATSSGSAFDDPWATATAPQPPPSADARKNFLVVRV